MPPLVIGKDAEVVCADVNQTLRLRTAEYGLVSIIIYEVGKEGEDIKLHSIYHIPRLLITYRVLCIMSSKKTKSPHDIITR